LWPERKKYSWVGIKPRPADDEDQNENEADSEKNNAKKGRGRGSELFMHADAHMISIGGGYVEYKY